MTESVATRDAYGQALVELGKKMPELVVLDADLAGSTRTARFRKVFPERFFNMGIAEQNMVNVAAGLASCGKVAFVSTFAIFATGRAWEQLRTTVAYTGLNVKIVASHGGITVGADGATHQSLEDVALTRVIPHMRVIVPCDGPETIQAVLSAARTPGPFYIRTGREKSPVITSKSDPFLVGKARHLAEGTDAAVIACGIMVERALRASETLRGEGLDIAVLNMHTIKPLDAEAVVQAATDCGAIVTAEEHSVIGGLGSAVAEVLAERRPVPLARVGVKDRFGQSGSPKDLLKAYGLEPEDIEKAVRCVIERKKMGRE